MIRRTTVVVAALAVLVVAQPAGAATHRAGVVIRANGQSKTYCVPFKEKTITGTQLLERSGSALTVDASAVGTAICKVGGVGCGSDNCFCKYPTFWGYWSKDPPDDKWNFSNIGADQRTIVDGAIDGWSWGRNGKPAPKLANIGDICTPQAMRAHVTAKPINALKEGARSKAPNYLPFVALLAVFVALGVLVIARRRRTT